MKKTILGATFAGLCALSYAGVTAVSSNAVQSQLNEIANGPGKQGLKLSALDHDKGLTASTGSLKIALDDRCYKNVDVSHLQTELRYTIKHTPTLSGLASFEFSLIALGEAQDLVQQATGNNVIVSGEGVRGFDGSWTSTFRTPAVNTSQAQASLTIPVSTGNVRISGTGADLDWSLANVSVTDGQGQSVSMDKFRAEAVITDTTTGLGTMQISVGQVTSDFGSLSQLSIMNETVQNGDRIDSITRPAIGKIDAMGQQYENIGAAFWLKGLDADAILTLSKTMENNCDPSELTKASLLSVENNLIRILDKGFRFGITDISAKGPDGNVAGGVEVSVAGWRAGTAETFAQRLSATGKIDAQGSLLPDAQQRMLVQTGFARQTDSGIQASVNLANGALTINDEPDAFGVSQMMDMMLGVADGFVSDWRNSLTQDEPLLGRMLEDI